MKGSSIKIIYVYLILVSIFTFLAPNSFATVAIDNSETAKIRSLTGKWEFYWQQLLTPSDFRSVATTSTSDTILKPDYIEVPSSWRGQTLSEHTNEGKRLPAHGYATYRKLLTVSPDKVGVNAALFFRYIDSAFRIWIDGVELEGAGTIGTSRSSEQPDLKMQLFYFTPRSQTIEIVIQVSNYSFREGGIVGEVKWAEANVLVRDVFKSIAMQDILFISCFLLFSLYHLIVYFSRPEDASFFWLGMLSLWMGIRAFLKSEYLIQLLFSWISWEHMIRFVFIAEVFAVMSIFMFFYVMYPKDAHRLPLRITLGYSALLLVYFLVSPTEQFTSTMLLHWSGYLLILFYCVPYLGIVSFFIRREGAVLNVLGLMLIAIATLNDLLYYAEVIDSVPMSPFAVFGFIFIQAINIAFKYSALFRSNLRLTTDLEHIVAEQTEELRQSNEQLLRFDQQRTKLLENIAHDLGSPLAGMKTHLFVLRSRHSEPEQHNRLISQMQMNVDNMSRQVQDLYDMTGIERNASIMHLEPTSVQALRESIAGLLQQRVEWEQIEVTWSPQAVVVDEQIGEQSAFVEVNLQGILRVVQNYLDNAIKFSFDDPCRIDIEWMIADGQLEFGLTDFGRGIPEEEMPRVFERFYKGEEKRKGIGLGLAIAKEIMERQGGTVGVRSEYGKGSTFSFRLPLMKQE